MQRVDDGGPSAEQRAEGGPDDARMVVDHVEGVVGVEVRGEGVADVEPHVAEQRGIGHVLERAHEPGLGVTDPADANSVTSWPRFGRLSASSDDHELDSAIATRRDGEPRRGDLGDAHGDMVALDRPARPE